jgi:undecaprenyl-diphosphatase
MKYITKEQTIQWIMISVGSVLLIISMFFDTFVNDKISLYKWPVLDVLFNTLSNFYLLIFVLLAASTYFMYISKKREGILPLWISFIATTVIVIIIKLLVARERPEEFSTFLLFMYSFPSLHAAVCFSTIAILDIEFPKLKWLWIILGVMIGISRIYLHAHFFSDVIAGALLGYVIGLVVWQLNGKYFHKIKW